MANRIHAKGTYRHEEAKANEADIYPGMLLVLDGNGEVGMHGTEGGTIGDEVLIAEEDALQGNTVDTVYEDDSIVSHLIPNKGSVVRMLLEDGEDVSIGEKIISAGNGLVKSYDNIGSGRTVAHVLGVTIEEMDLTGSTATNTLIMVRVV